MFTIVACIIGLVIAAVAGPGIGIAFIIVAAVVDIGGSLDL